MLRKLLLLVYSNLPSVQYRLHKGLAAIVSSQQGSLENLPIRARDMHTQVHADVRLVRQGVGGRCELFLDNLGDARVVSIYN
jgi:hypothetical protein